MSLEVWVGRTWTMAYTPKGTPPGIVSETRDSRLEEREVVHIDQSISIIPGRPSVFLTR